MIRSASIRARLAENNLTPAPEADPRTLIRRAYHDVIGLPPTPFDSIEAAFAAPISVKGMHVYRYGTIKGRMQVEPFAAGSFLLGFYRLEDAVMESSS